jgi:BRCA1-associated protein
MEQEEKVEGITLEYTYLLTQQLDSQRRYFEERLAEVESKNNDKVFILLFDLFAFTSSFKHFCNVQISKLEESLNQYKNECAQLQKDVQTSQQDLKTTEKRLQQALQKMQKVWSRCVRVLSNVDFAVGNRVEGRKRN